VMVVSTRQLQLTAVLAGCEDHELGQVNDHLRAATGSVSTHGGLLRSVAWSLWIMGSECPWWCLNEDPLTAFGQAPVAADTLSASRNPPAPNSGNTSRADVAAPRTNRR
jgi:hypothetical protein